MPLPRKLRNFQAFVDGRGYLGQVMEVVPPTLTVSTEEHRGAGMDAPVEIDMGMEVLTAELTFSEYAPEVLQLWGISQSQIPLTLRGAVQADGAVQALALRLRGYFKGLDPGTWKPGESTECKLTATLRYYALEIDGRTQIEIDVDNLVRRIGGVDQLAAQRRALGL